MLLKPKQLHRISNLEDIFIIEAFLQDSSVKNAGIEDIAGAVKNYIKSQYDPERPVASILNLLTPSILGSLGFPWVGFLLSLAKIVFGVNFTGIFQTIVDKLKSIFLTKKKPTTEQVNSIVDETIQNHFETGVENLGGLADLLKQKTSAIQFRDQLISLAKKYNNECPHDLLIKEAILGSALKSKTSNIFSKLIKWVVTLSLGTAGLIAGGAAYSAITGKLPDPKQKTILPEKTIETPLPTKKPVSFKEGPKASSFKETHNNDKYNAWIEPNHFSSIKEQLKDWAISIYPELKDNEQKIETSIDFKKTLDYFLKKNKDSASLIVIPDDFSSIKDIVDQFAGDIKI